MHSSRKWIVRSITGGLFVSAVGLVFAPPAGAHGEPPSLDFYGNFQSAADCQRRVSRVARLCFERVLFGKLRCDANVLAGRGCDTGKFESLVGRAVSGLERDLSGCSDGELAILGYESRTEALSDLTESCREEAQRALEVVFAPAMYTGRIEPGARGRDRCLRLTARFAVSVLRSAARQKARALDIIASGNFSRAQKLDILARAEERVRALRDRGAAVAGRVCTPEEFAGSYRTSPGELFARIVGRADCVVAASHVQNAVTCAAPVCGNGVREEAEECDDGNDADDDACRNDCRRAECEVFPSTFALIQAAIFEKRGCTSQGCHDSASRQGGLDLTRGASYGNLLRIPSQRDPRMVRLEPGAPDESLLYLKLAAATIPESYDPAIGAPMPVGLPPLRRNELEAVRIWIRDGAPETGVVQGTGELLDACLPPPDPVEIPPPPPPAPGEGVQLRMPRFLAPPHSETEVCFASYYDFTEKVPARFLDPTGTRFRYKSEVMTQDPLSHHLVRQPYTGSYGPRDPVWGKWTCKGGERDGEECDPLDLDFCGPEGTCGSEPRRSVACIGYGPPDHNAVAQQSFTGIGETRGLTRWAPGVYDEFPVRGIVIWNSHNFNLSDRPGKVEAWSNFYFAEPEEQRHRVERVTDARFVFVMNVPPFEQREYCATYTFPRGVRVFQVSSHTHKRGKLFRIWNPSGELVYLNTTYEDPLQVNFDPPLLLDAEDPAARTFRYCALYDNGLTDPGEVKRRSTSPPPPPPFPFVPCTATHCAEGRVGEPCSGSTEEERNRSCDTAPGAGDGLCDACAVTGGVTTDDEMFVFLAAYY
ncbi:MAG: hypothetical protein KatS3mg076_2866 [Candidatus Binatia bacterium]|nr:MAG: hypothetical protein KatS3mg076_2866 [Candidatus Binatia bacterium]